MPAGGAGSASPSSATGVSGADSATVTPTQPSAEAASSPAAPAPHPVTTILPRGDAFTQIDSTGNFTKVEVDYQRIRDIFIGTDARAPIATFSMSRMADDVNVSYEAQNAERICLDAGVLGQLISVVEQTRILII